MSRLAAISFSPLARTPTFIAVLVLLCLTNAKAETIRSNVVCREDIESPERTRLTDQLRVITGLMDLSFDDAGALQPGVRAEATGSKTARALLLRAVQGSNPIIIEDVSGRSDVVFARVVEGKRKQQMSPETPVFVIQIDFADFEHLMGDKLALKAFDSGWAFLHELDHIVENSRDASSVESPGQCEDHINQMRLECNLPLRADYFHTLMPLPTNSEFVTKIVRLSFVKGETGSRKKKRYWVIWDARLVGGLDGVRKSDFSATL